MRILYSHRIQSRDGQSVHVEALVAAFRAEGHEVLVVGPGFYEASGFGGESRAVARLRRMLPGAAAELAELAYNVPAYRRLSRAARSFRPDLIYERYNLYYLAGAALARRRRIPFFVEVNAPLAAERSRHGDLRLRRLAAAGERDVWRAADRLFAVTGVLADMVAAEGVARDRIVVTPNGIDLGEFDQPPASDRPGMLTLGFVGFVRDWHGLDAVIASLAADRAAPPLALSVVGDGPVRGALERQAVALGVADRVQFTGLAPRESIPGHVTRFDIALQPASVAYASPLKLFEYMAASRAIVAPDQPNIREVLRDGETALLFEPGRPEALWAAVRRLAGDPDLRRRLGEAARAELLRRDYTWAGNARRVVALAETLGPKHRRGDRAAVGAGGQ